jgi:hypothetical protein
MADTTDKDESVVEEAVTRTHQWAHALGPQWVGVFDQFHADVRGWSEEVGVDPLSYEFRATWLVACRALGLVAGAGTTTTHPAIQAKLDRLTAVVATVGMWGAIVTRPEERSAT